MCKHSCTFRGFAEAEIHCLQRRPHLQAKGHVTLKRSENVCDSLRGKRGKCCGERFSRPHLKFHAKAFCGWRINSKLCVCCVLTVILIEPTVPDKAQVFMCLLWRQLFNVTKWWSDGILYPKGQLHLQRYHVMKARRSSELWKTVVCKWKQHFCSLITFYLNRTVQPQAHFKTKKS